jgi:hypothetical protein
MDRRGFRLQSVRPSDAVRQRGRAGGYGLVAGAPTWEPGQNDTGEGETASTARSRSRRGLAARGAGLREVRVQQDSTEVPTLLEQLLGQWGLFQGKDSVHHRRDDSLGEQTKHLQ